jgi:hypothetical protein
LSERYQKWMKVATIAILMTTQWNSAALAQGPSCNYSDKICVDKCNQYSYQICAKYAGSTCLKYEVAFVSCDKKGDWGTPLATDYHPGSDASMVRPPSQIVDSNGTRTFYNDFPEIKGTKENLNNHDFRMFHDLRDADPTSEGKALSQELLDLFSSPQHGNSEIADWLSGRIKNNQPLVGQASWQGSSIIGSGGGEGWGSCENWSAMATDPHLQQTLAQIKNVFGCDGFTFERGPLKDIFMALMPPPINEDSTRNHVMAGSYATKTKVLDDVNGQFDEQNLSMAKLGLLGNGNAQPQDFLAMIENTSKNPGRGMMIEKNMGYNSKRKDEIWNQPLSQAFDVVYHDAASSTDSLKALDMTATPGNNGAEVLLLQAEGTFEAGASAGTGVPYQMMCDITLKVHNDCSWLGDPKLWSQRLLSDQMTAYNHLKNQFYESHLVEPSAYLNNHDAYGNNPDNSIAVVHHELVMVYGKENFFGSNVADTDRLVTKSYDYDSVYQRDPNNPNTGKLLRSTWRPRSLPLGQVCAKPSLASERAEDDDTNTLAIKCQQLKNKQISPDEQFIVQALPPKALKSFDYIKKDDWNTPEGLAKYMPHAQAKALHDFDEMIRNNCGQPGTNQIDKTSVFLQDLWHSLGRNGPTAEQMTQMKSEFPVARNWLTNDWIKQLLDVYQVNDSTQRKLFTDQINGIVRQLPTQ